MFGDDPELREAISPVQKIDKKESEEKPKGKKNQEVYKEEKAQDRNKK